MSARWAKAQHHFEAVNVQQAQARCGRCNAPSALVSPSPGNCGERYAGRVHGACITTSVDDLC